MCANEVKGTRISGGSPAVQTTVGCSFKDISRTRLKTSRHAQTTVPFPWSRIEMERRQGFLPRNNKMEFLGWRLATWQNSAWQHTCRCHVKVTSPISGYQCYEQWVEAPKSGRRWCGTWRSRTEHWGSEVDLSHEAYVHSVHSVHLGFRLRKC